MARFILKWRYIKSSAAKHGNNLVKYIATREGVQTRNDLWENEPATVDQKRLIEELVRDFPNTKNTFEYQDFIAKETKSTASEFIDRAIEENIDLIGKKENYIGYIAKRPRVEKQGTHGLFSADDKPINLDDVAKTVANHQGVVWTTIMSLRREDSELLGYDNANAWKNLLRTNQDRLAKAMGIPLPDLRWYAAFHNEGNHPHIHLVAYSDGAKPYMNSNELITLKSDFAKEIFKNELYHIYDDQTQYRDELRQKGREKIANIVEQINSGSYRNETIELMLKQLAKELDGYKGKKIYGYLPKHVKNIIDGIVDELSKDDRIKELYRLWYEQRELIIKTYQDKMPEHIPLSQNKEFKSIKNAIIQEALRLNDEAFLLFDEYEDTEFETETDSNDLNNDGASDEDIIHNNSQPDDEESEEDASSSANRNNQSTPNQPKEKYYPQSSLALSSMRLLARLSQIIQDDLKKHDDNKLHIDKKLQQKIEEKRQAQGQKMG